MLNSRRWILCVTLGCAETLAETTPPAPPPVVVEAPAPAPVAAPAPVGEAAAPATVELEVVVDNTYMPWAPSDGAVSAASKADRVDFGFDVVPSYCSLVRPLTGVAKGDVLEVTLVRTEDAIPCTGMTVVVEAHVVLPGPLGLKRVVVREHDGKVLAQGPITSAL